MLHRSRVICVELKPSARTSPTADLSLSCSTPIADGWTALKSYPSMNSSLTYGWAKSCKPAHKSSDLGVGSTCLLCGFYVSFSMTCSSRWKKQEYLFKKSCWWFNCNHQHDFKLRFGSYLHRPQRNVRMTFSISHCHISASCSRYAVITSAISS